MAEDMDSDTCVGVKRRVKEIQETQTLPQRSDSPCAIPQQERHSSEMVSPPRQAQDFIDKSPPCVVTESSTIALHFKKVKCSPQGQVCETHLEEMQDMLDSVNGNSKACGFVSGFCGSEGIAQENCKVGFLSDVDFIDKSPPCVVTESSTIALHFKKVKCSPQGQVCETHLEEMQDMLDSVNGNSKACGFVSGFCGSEGITQENCKVGFLSDVDFVKAEAIKTVDDEKESAVSDLVDKQGKDSVISEVGLAGTQKIMQEMNFVTEGDCKEGLAAYMSTSVENKELLGKEMESQSFLEAKKKRLLEEVEAILVPAEKTHEEKVVDSTSLSTFVENKELLGKEVESQSSLEVKKKQLLEEVEAVLVLAEKTREEKVVDSTEINGKRTGYTGVHSMVQSGTGASVSSLKIEIVDETALIESVAVPKPGFGCGKDLGFGGPAKCVTQRNGNKNARQEMKGKKARAPRRKEKVERNGKPENATHMVEAHSQCLKNGKGTKIIYSRMEMEAMRFVNIVEQRNLWKNIYRGLGPVVAREYDDLASSKHQKNTHINFDPRKRPGKMEEAPGLLGEAFSENVDIELRNLANNEAQDASLLDPVCSYSAIDEDGYPFPEESSDDDSDEDYASIQRPAFLVEGEPNFDSGSPEDGLEYLRHVRWEAAQIPKVRVAKLDGSKIKSEQSAYMPKIPEIAKCPEQLLPLKHWEDAFLAEFSELRLAVSHFEGDNANKSQDIIFENFSDVKSKEVDFYEPHDCSILVNSINQPSSSTTEGSNPSLSAENLNPKPKPYMNQSSSDPPSLLVMLRMDSVARVSMLTKRINAIEGMSTLSRNECLWLFALCAVVDTPLDADTSASLRSLLRKCAALRAAKTVPDDEIVMLNILATISGRYFGQSEN